jgi:hypothetical protein
MRVLGHKSRSPLLFAVLLVSTSGCFGGQRVERLEEVSLERTRCYGWCPSYLIVVFADGRVEYEGREFVKATGKALRQLSRVDLEKLVDEINRANYFNLRDRYAREEDGCPTVWTDSPVAITSVRADGRLKTIRHYHGCQDDERNSSVVSIYPRALTELEDQIDRIVKTEEWIGTEEERRVILSKQNAR